MEESGDNNEDSEQTKPSEPPADEQPQPDQTEEAPTKSESQPIHATTQSETKVEEVTEPSEPVAEATPTDVEPSSSQVKASSSAAEKPDETLSRSGQARSVQLVGSQTKTDEVTVSRELHISEDANKEFKSDDEDAAPAQSKSSVLRQSSSGVEKKSSLIYKHDFSSVLSVGRQASLKDELTIKRGLGSKGRLALGSIISIRRTSLTGDMYDKGKVPRYMNTYRLESDNPFNPEKVEKILKVVVHEALENLTYDHDKCAKQAKWASSAIRGQVKDLKFDRYKLVCLMTIGEKNSQDVYATCRFLWDVERDRYAVYAHENTYVYGYAQCFGLYYE